MMNMILALLAISYAHATTARSNEGFFDPSSVPAERLTEIGADTARVIARATLVTGAFVYSHPETLDAEKARAYIERYCQDPAVAKWFQESCAQVKACAEKASCTITAEGHCGGVAIASDRFLTTRHCPLGEDLKTLAVKFLQKDGSVRRFPIRLTTEINGYVPYDLAVFEIVGRPNTSAAAVVSARVPPADAWVFSVGFPNSKYRKSRNLPYADAVGEMKVSVGQIVDPNSERKSFCDFGFEDVQVMLPESWRLQATCPQAGEHETEREGRTYRAHVEKDPFLTNTDMLNGMSGAPLFNAKGEVVGIGTALLKNGAPFDYDARYPAVYVKAAHHRDLKPPSGRP